MKSGIIVIKAMKQNVLYLILLLSHAVISHAQINLNAPDIIFDQSHISFDPYQLIAADIDNDGQKDIISLSRQMYSIMWFKNYNGDFSQDARKTIYNDSQYVDRIAILDIDNDGWVDVVGTDVYNDRIVLIRNAGDGIFEDPLDITVQNPRLIVAFDINSDGREDIVFTDSSSRILYMLNQTTGFSPPVLMAELSANNIEKIELYDFDQDGLQDIFADTTSGMRYLRNLGDTTFQQNPTFTGEGDSFVLRDCNDDGLIDFVTISYYGLVVFLNQNGSFSQNPEILVSDTSLYNTNIKLSLADADNDGISEIILHNQTSLRIVKELFPMLFYYTTTVVSGLSISRTFCAADFNLDGNIEFVISSFANQSSIVSDNYIAMLTQQENGTYDKKRINFHTGAPFSLSTGDLNGDGRPDIFAGMRPPVIFLNNENGWSPHQFTLPENTSVNATHFTYDSEITDMDADGIPDIVLSAQNGQRVLFNDGTASFTPVNISDFSNSRRIELADLDGDGLKEILITAHNNSFKLKIIKNLGNRTFAPPLDLNYNSYYYKPKTIRCADIDQDGDLDILVGSGDYYTLQWWENQGNMTFSYHNIPNPGSGPDVVLLEDINADAKPDIICGTDDESSSGSIHYKLNNGNGTFGLPILIGAQNPKNMILADMNGDGLKDLVATSYFYHGLERLIYYQNTGNGFLAGEVIEDLEPVSMNRDVAAIDINLDGKTDLISSYYFINEIKQFLNATNLSDGISTIPEAKRIVLFPNPSSQKIQWKGLTGETSVEIYSLDGKQVVQTTTNDNSLPIEQLENGIYLLNLKNPAGDYTLRFIKN